MVAANRQRRFFGAGSDRAGGIDAAECGLAKIGLLLHKIVSPIVLGIMFFLVVTPLGFVMRALGKDLLRLKLERDAKTYWIHRTPPGPDR